MQWPFALGTITSNGVSLSAFGLCFMIFVYLSLSVSLHNGQARSKFYVDWKYRVGHK